MARSKASKKAPQTAAQAILSLQKQLAHLQGTQQQASAKKSAKGSPPNLVELSDDAQTPSPWKHKPPIDSSDEDSSDDEDGDYELPKDAAGEYDDEAIDSTPGVSPSFLCTLMRCCAG